MKFVLSNFLKKFKKKRFYKSIFNEKDKYIFRSNATWGSFLHKDNISHKNIKNCHLKNIIEKYISIKNFRGNILEMGCGRANDLEYFLTRNVKFSSYIASDIGSNVQNLNKKILNKKVYFINADNHSIPISNNSFDTIYSFGSFHHCKNFKDVLIEAKRLLKKNGTLIFYNYKKYQNYKKYFIAIENLLLRIFSYTGYSSTKIFSKIFSYFVYLIFVVPAQILKIFSKNIFRKIPFNYCTNLNSVYRNLIDRL
ncbi:class I SAM-dependent methyltransferase, partial [Candidatus Pelagibacter sp.]|nr:class I SAM-dependent methyltransferase [Candidatus Pelagibacter sp.]